MAPCNCKGGGTGSVFELVSPAGKTVGRFLTRPEALAHLTKAGPGHRVVTRPAK